MKLLLINSVCGIRSTGRICTDLAQGCIAAGWEAKVAYGRETVPGHLSHLAQPIGGKWNVYAHGFRARLLDDSGRGSAGATRAFLRWVEAYDPDVIHLHNLHGYYLNLELLFSYLRRCGKKILWTLHDGWAYAGHSATCDEADCTRWKTGCHDCPLRSVYPASLTDRSARNWREKKQWFTGIPNLTIVCPSQWLATQVRQSFLGSYPIEVIPNGIDTAAFTPGDAPSQPGTIKTVLGVASSWTDSKGYSDFLRLPSLLGENIRLTMVGVTEQQKAALPGSIRGVTRTNSVQELTKLYREADLLLNLTYCDTYPTVNLEALCCGTPVVTYATGGSPESIPPGLGRVVPRGDLAAAAQAVREVLASDAKQQAFRHASTLRQQLHKDRATEACLALYGR